MLVREGTARTHGADRGLACSLAFVAGSLNAAGFYAVGFYSGNMTGNTTAVADHLAMGDVWMAALYCLLIVTFIIGAMISTLLINFGRRRKLGSVYLLSILSEAVLLMGLGLVDLFAAATWRGEFMVFGLSFLLGLQNALVTRISNARVRTTHVTGMVTDIGIEIGDVISVWARGEPANQADRQSLSLHVQTVIAFLLGGVLGVATYQRVGPVLLLGMSVFLLVLVTPDLLKQRAAS